jgi:hypothetical protein
MAKALMKAVARLRVTALLAGATGVVLLLWLGLMTIGSLAATDSALPASKQAIASHLASLQAEGRAHPAAIPANPTNPFSSQSVPDPTIGAIAGAGRLNASTDTVPPPGIKGTFTNSWYVIGPPLTATVWAGAHSDGSRQGMLVVATWPDRAATGSAEVQEYDAPSPAGVLTIVGVEGTVLDLVDTSGDNFTFDVSSRAYR